MTSFRDDTAFTRKLFDNKIYCICLGLIFILLSNIIGHFAPPFSILITPVLLPIIIGGVNFSVYKSNYYLTILYGFGLLLLNDLLIRFFAGGTHDREGKDWISAFSMLAFVISIMTMIFLAFRLNKKGTLGEKILTVSTKILFVIVVAAFIGLFYDKYLSNV